MSTIVDGGVARKQRRVEPKPKPKPKLKPKPNAKAKPEVARGRSRAPFAGGVAWIVVVGVLLAGIVAVNVLVLQLNMQFDGLSRERAQLKADNALLRSQLSSASASVRIEDAAKTKLGLQAADPLSTTYVRLGK